VGTLAGKSRWVPLNPPRCLRLLRPARFERRPPLRCVRRAIVYI